MTGELGADFTSVVLPRANRSCLVAELPNDQAEQTLAMIPLTQHSVSARALDLTTRRSLDPKLNFVTVEASAARKPRREPEAVLC